MPPHVLPAVPLRPGRRPNDHYNQPQHPPPHAPHGVPEPYQYPHPHAHQYPPQQYRTAGWGAPYAQYSVPPPQHYPNTPLVVSSYPHSQPPPPPPPQSAPRQSQAPPPPPPRPTSSSTQSQAYLSPSTSTTSLNVATPPPRTSTAPPRPQTPPLPAPSQFVPPLPWYSVPEEPFPPRARRRRRKRAAPAPSDLSLELPSSRRQSPRDVQPAAITSAVPAAASRSETPVTSQPPSETDSTNPTTPSSTLPPASSTAPSGPAPTKAAPRPILPAIPLASVVPHAHQATAPVAARDPASEQPSAGDSDAKQSAGDPRDSTDLRPDAASTSPSSDQQTPKASSPPPRAAPKSWADLVRSNAPKAVPASNGAAFNVAPTNGSGVSRTGTLADVLNSFSVDRTEGDDAKIAFLEPKGLVNTGNMCYMNAVLQVLIFCVPFYGFLDRVGKQAAHSFKSDTPLLDAMILFMREFSVIDSALSAEQLKLRLKDAELEQYGEAFTPEFVYEVIRSMPRFASMRRGHQQDAEEFLGFLLEGLHDECAQVLQGAHSSGVSSPGAGPVSPSRDLFSGAGVANEDGWLEVGPKQKAAVTRSSGMITTESPITKIFGGKLRSELRVQGLKNSVTLEPYQPLQLDIQSPHVDNITDALRGLTRSETLHGDFNSPRGPGATATKQVFIETLPPVLILHLKRFQYDNTGGTQKIWKKIGYPLQLEIPKEAFPPHRRASLALHGGLPRYRLIGVVYHHGKNASGGHYTVDVRRQDGREWIRLDDTVIRRLRSEDVAEGGSEEGPKVLASPLEQQRSDTNVNSNMFGSVNVDQEQSEAGWSQVNGAGVGQAEPKRKAWTGSVNGSTTPTGGHGRSGEKASLRDSKVAYLLFYQRI
ncbi:MAG: hypothetical protein M1832_003896 [Thelocarpon impressellum]|nr:MAG: hypothetical protein M1832_003896 [Thelocarpon impressellum]